MTAPYTITGIPGTFITPGLAQVRFYKSPPNEVTRAMTAESIRLGGGSVSQYTAELPSGEILCAICGREPCMDDGSVGWHLSVSIWPLGGQQCRLPTWCEMKIARFRLVKRGIKMSMEMPDCASQWVDANAFTLHLFESQ